MLTTSHIRRDRYGRILSDIVLHDTTLTELLVKAGHSCYGVGKPAATYKRKHQPFPEEDMLPILH